MALRTIWLIAFEDLRLRLTLTLWGSETLPLEKPPAASGDPALGEAEGIEPSSGEERFRCGCRAKTPRRADRDRLPSGPARREAHVAARHLASRSPVPRRDTRAFRGMRVERLALPGYSAVASRASSTRCPDSPSDLGHAVAFDDGRPDSGMNRLPDRQIDVDNPPRLGRIRRPRDGHVKTLTARVGGDEAKRLQKFLQVADKAWSIDDDVQAAVGLRSCRNEVPFSHCRDEAAPVKGSQHDVDEQEQGSRRTFSRCALPNQSIGLTRMICS
jgi:hypothetical protein